MNKNGFLVFFIIVLYNEGVETVLCIMKMEEKVWQADFIVVAFVVTLRA